MQESWTRVLSFVLVFLSAVHVQALPKNKGNSNTGTNVAAAATSGGITKATDGSTILDKTVQIKCASFLTWHELSINCG
jgi:hypothetical protein